MTGPIHQFEDLYADAASRRDQPRTRPRREADLPGGSPRVGVLYNPRSHRNKGNDLTPAELPNVRLGLPHGRERIAEELEKFAQDGIAFLVINGGDGTVRDVLTCGQTVFGDDWPEIAVLPKGKTNALNVDLGAPSGWNLSDAIDAWHTGRRIVRRPLVIERVEGDGGAAVVGFIFGAGVFSTAVRAGQDAHRMGAFNSLAVGVTALWGGLQVIFGRDTNVWRCGAKMDITLLPGGEKLPHSRYGDADRRSILLASTLERFPMGVQLFGRPHGGLKLTVLDHARRRLMPILPAVMAGYRPNWLTGAGLHQLDVDAFEIALTEPFILDGEAFPEGRYRISQGAPLTFVVP